MRVFLPCVVVVLAASAVEAHGDERADCRAEIAVDGDDAVAAGVRAAVVERKRLARTQPASCGVMRARVSGTGSQVIVEMIDPRGRLVRRTVHSLEMAAVIIESWAIEAALPSAIAQAPKREHVAEYSDRIQRSRTAIVSRASPQRAHEDRTEERTQETSSKITNSAEHEPAATGIQRDAGDNRELVTSTPSEATLDNRLDARTSVAAPDVEHHPETRTPLAPADDLSRPVRDPIDANINNRDTYALAARAETSIGNDGSLWAGGRIGACLYLGPVCSGLSFRLIEQVRPRANVEADGDRSGGDLSLTADLVIDAGAARISPGIELGFGLVHDVFDSPTHELIRDSFTPRAGAHLAVGVPVSESLAIDFAFAFAAAFGAITRSRQIDDGSIPGEPGIYVRAAIGAQFGGP